MSKRVWKIWLSTGAAVGVMLASIKLQWNRKYIRMDSNSKMPKRFVGSLVTDEEIQASNRAVSGLRYTGQVAVPRQYPGNQKIKE